MKQLTEEQLKRLLRAAYNAGFLARTKLNKELDTMSYVEFETVWNELEESKGKSINHLAGQF